MTFYTEADRLAHPQAKLIPKHLWPLFNDYLSDELITLMQANAKDLPDLCRDFMNTLDSRLPLFDRSVYMLFHAIQLPMWIAIASSHPELSYQDLMNIGEVISDNFGFSIGDLIVFSVYWGSEDYFQATINQLIAKHGREAVYQTICNKTGEFLNGDNIIDIALSHNYLSILHILETIFPDFSERMHRTANDDRSSGLGLAICNGFVEVLTYIEKYVPELFNVTLAKGYQGMGEWRCEPYNFLDYTRDSIYNGHLKLVQHLEKIHPNFLKAMFELDNFTAVSAALNAGHVHILEYFHQKMPEAFQSIPILKITEMVSSALFNGRVESVGFLFSTHPEFISVLNAENFRMFETAVRCRNPRVINFLLNYPDVLAYAEDHPEHGPLVNAYVDNVLSQLRELLPHLAPNEKEAKHLFYILRNLIQRNDETFHEDMLMLIHIPAVTALLHKAVSSKWSQVNELLHFAIKSNNSLACSLLLDIPEVYKLAESNNFYRSQLNRSPNPQKFNDIFNIIQASKSLQILINQGGTFFSALPHDLLGVIAKKTVKSSELDERAQNRILETHFWSRL